MHLKNWSHHLDLTLARIDVPENGDKIIDDLWDLHVLRDKTSDTLHVQFVSIFTSIVNLQSIKHRERLVQNISELVLSNVAIGVMSKGHKFLECKLRDLVHTLIVVMVE